MSVLDFIERLREKSVRERKQWALGIAFGVTLFIGLIWATFLAARLAGTTVSPVTENQTSVETDTPFGTLFGGLREAWSSFKESVGSVGSIDYAPSSSSAENGLR
ncbi:hypothetical protein K8Q93_02255 [Candidatus Parcubacteria bacterium]|nr:hypothetical protein [Candidatus Parcubacteria bacterium]